MQKMIVVLGMHRSGTSAIARGLQVLGVDLGGELLPAQKDNEKGFWEDAELNKINVELMRELGADWFTIPPVSATDLVGPNTHDFHNRALDILRKRCRDNIVFGFKDPRTAELLPFWHGVFDEFGADVGYVVVCRNPLSVAQSLSARNHFDRLKSLLLWYGVMSSALRYSKGFKKVVVDYDNLIADPALQLQRIADTLDLPFNSISKEFQVYVDQFLSNDLRHNYFTMKDLKDSKEIPGKVVDFYQLLMKLADGSVNFDDGDVATDIEQVLTYFDEISPILDYLGLIDRRLIKRDEQIAHLRQTKAERDEQITHLSQTIAERDEQITHLIQTMAERDEQITHLSQTMAERDEQITHLSQTMAERDEQITHLSQTMAERDEQVTHLRQTIVERDEQITHLSQTMAERDEQITHLSQTMAERDEQITHLSQTMAERDEQVTHLRQTIVERDEQVQSLNHVNAEHNLKIARMQSELDEMRGSRSWRITTSLRYIGRQTKRVKQIWQVFLITRKLDGNLLISLRKAFHIYRREGWIGVRRRILARWNIAKPKAKNELSPPVEQIVSRRPWQPPLGQYDDDVVNYYGYILAESGLGTACRGYINALQLGKLEVHSINLPCGLSEVDFPVQAAPSASAMFNIVHMNADSIEYFFSVKGRDCLNDRYNIGIWVWELAAFRPDWFESFQPFDEIWVPSEFCRKSISAISPVPVYVIPHVLEQGAVAEVSDGRRRFNIQEDAFVFGYMFDCSSSIARKNPFALIDAFQQAFENNNKALLLLKFSNGKKDEKLYRKIREAVDGHQNIMTIEGSLTELELKQFFDAIDCYVSPHRSEGFGLTIAEAMLSGKPVIATNYGGTTDFVKPEHAYPVKYHLIPIREQYGPYLPNYLWADIEIDHLVERLQEVFNDPEVALTHGEAGRGFINEYCSVSRIADLMKDRLQSALS